MAARLSVDVSDGCRRTGPGTLVCMVGTSAVHDAYVLDDSDLFIHQCVRYP